MNLHHDSRYAVAGHYSVMSRSGRIVKRTESATVARWTALIHPGAEVLWISARLVP